VPENPSEAEALYEKARAAQAAEAGPLLAKIERDFGDAPLAAACRASARQMGPASMKTLPAERQSAGEDLAMTAVRTHPSAVTAELLSRASALLNQWDVETANLSVGRRFTSSTSERWRSGRPRTTATRQVRRVAPRTAPDWHFHGVGGGQMLALSPERLRAASSRVAASAQILLPDYFQSM
jgi:hypothetical protein